MSDPARETEPELKARRGRNIALALGLVLFVVTLVRLGGNVAQSPL